MASLAALRAPEAHAGPGDHVRWGAYTLEPGVLSAVEYHSNAFLADGLINEVHPALSLHVRPQLRLRRDGELDVVAIRGAWNVRKFLDLDPADAFVTGNLDRLRDMDLDVSADLRKKSVLGLRIDDHFEVISSPAQLESAAADTDANIRLTSNDARATVVVRPGSALEVGLVGIAGMDRYDVPAILTSDGNPNLNNRSGYGPMLDARWRFLPRTSVVTRVTWYRLDWENNLVNAVGPDVAAEGNPFGAYIGKPDATKWHAVVGLRGQVTDALAVVAEVGLGQMDYDETSVLGAPGAAATGEAALGGTESFATDLDSLGEGLTANVLVRYGFGRAGDKPRHAVSVGYKKDFQDAFFTNYVVFQRVDGKYTANLTQGLAVDTEATARVDDYHGEVTRTDLVFSVRGGLTWQPRLLGADPGTQRRDSPFTVNASLGWNERACADAECEDGGFYGVQYDDFYSSLGVSFTY
jgi:hypothetical protein